MSLERIQPAGLAKSPMYSHVIKAGNTVYVAGQVARDASGKTVGAGDITAQTVQVFENIKAALSSASAGFDDLVRITVYITDPRFREAVGKVRALYITGPTPTSTLLVVAGLAEPEFMVEIEVTAVVG